MEIFIKHRDYELIRMNKLQSASNHSLFVKMLEDDKIQKIFTIVDNWHSDKNHTDKSRSKNPTQIKL